MAIRHELALSRETLHRLSFENAFRAVEVVEYAAVKDKEAGADKAGVDFGFSMKRLTWPCASDSSTPKREIGGTDVTVASLPWLL